jgi:molybdenum cofactor synthesis domain-containing protein
MVDGPSAALLVIGAEVLSAKVEDENGPFLAKALRQRGVEVVEIRIIQDDPRIIADAVRTLSTQSDLVITTGGIGPTHDDLTIEGVAAGLGVEVVEHPELIQWLQTKYGPRLEEVRRMARVPAGAKLIRSDKLPLPTILAGNVFVLPGVPSLMRLCFEQMLPFVPQAVFHEAFILLNVSETKIAGHLSRVQDAFPEVAIGSYPRFDDAPYKVKVTLDGRDEKMVQEALRSLLEQWDTSWVNDTGKLAPTRQPL